MNLYKISQHRNFPKNIEAVIEIPKGTSAKYEYDPRGFFRYDRSLISAMVYPSNYGFIPNTLAEDGDALDVLVYNRIPIDRGTVVECNVIGYLDMEDEDSAGKMNKDYKILAVPTSHERNYKGLSDIDSQFLKVCKNFFLHYKDLNNQKVNVFDWHDKEEAHDIVEDNAKPEIDFFIKNSLTFI
jgi:inorganic pyrophosphatase